MVKKKARKGTKKKAARKSTRVKRQSPVQKIETLIEEFGQLEDDEFEEALQEMEGRAHDALIALKEDPDEEDDD